VAPAPGVDHPAPQERLWGAVGLDAADGDFGECLLDDLGGGVVSGGISGRRQIGNHNFRFL
jgi:hypothetical protein